MLKILRRHPRGASILVLSFFFMNIMFLVAYALFQVLPAEMHAANRSYTDLKGHYVARAGIEDSMGWLKHQMEAYELDQREEKLPDYRVGDNYPLIEAFLSEANDKRPFTDGDWRYELEIQPMQDPLSEDNILEARLYSIRSTSFLSDRPIRTVDVLVKQKTFALFSFYDSNADPNKPTAMRLTGQPQFEGPVHSNSYYNFNTSGMNWGTALPTFGDVVTHSKKASSAPANGDGNIWTGGAPYDSGNSYEAVFKGGRKDLRLKNHINLPTNTGGLADRAYPGTPPEVGGVHLSVDSSNRLNGGIYVAGDVDKANLRLDRFGNQKIEFSQIREAGSTKTVQNKNVNCKTTTVTVPPYTVNVSPCLTWSEPSGDAGGVAGPPASPVCTKWTQETRTTKNETTCDTIQVEVESPNYQPYETHVYEVTEAPVTVTGPDGPVTAQVGQTLVLNRHMDRLTSGKPWVVDEVQVFDGQINGTIFVNGNIGNKNANSDSSSNDSRREGLWGITKGSAVMDSSGQFVLDSHGKKLYNNKTIVTPLNKEISIGGDLMQFDAEKFAALGGPSGPNYEQVVSNKHNWHNVARNPNAASREDRLSPNNHHVLGIVTRDAWLNGPKKDGNQNPWTGNNTRRQMVGNDGVNHVYAVFLAGRSEVDSNGNPLLDADGNPIVSGGFGTWHERRNQLTKGIGEYKIFGGVIQGTTSNNPGTNSAHTHHWVDGSGSVGYDVGIEYDIEATKQREFPNFPEFRILRYFERNARA